MTITSGPSVVRAARGSQISCLGWQQEAALRMLCNNLDPAVAEHPEELIVYGGSGKAARNWECFEEIVRTLRRLRGDETLLVQSGKPVAVFRTHTDAPRVLLANSLLVPHWATADEFRRLDRRRDQLDRDIARLARLTGDQQRRRFLLTTHPQQLDTSRQENDESTSDREQQQCPGAHGLARLWPLACPSCDGFCSA